MSLLLRFAFFFVLTGFIGGFLLRRTWPGRLPEAILLAALPWLVHLGYALFWAATTYDAVLSGILVGLLDVGLAVATLRTGPRLYRRDSRRAGAAFLAARSLFAVGHVGAPGRRIVSDAAEPVLRRRDAVCFGGAAQLRAADTPRTKRSCQTPLRAR